MFKGFENLMNMGSLLKQAQQIGGRMQQITAELKNRKVEGTAGGGMVMVEANGVGEILRCKIEPSLVTSGDRELIEDLLPAAINQALERAKQLHGEALRGLGDGLDVPGLENMLSQLSGGSPSDTPRA